MTFADLVARNAALSGEVRRSHEALKIAQLTIDKMKVELTYLRRMKYGRSSEKLEHAQLELVGGQVAQPVVEPPADAGTDDGLKSNVTSLDAERKKREPKTLSLIHIWQPAQAIFGRTWRTTWKVPGS